LLRVIADNCWLKKLFFMREQKPPRSKNAAGAHSLLVGFWAFLEFLEVFGMQINFSVKYRHHEEGMKEGNEELATRRRGLDFWMNGLVGLVGEGTGGRRVLLRRACADSAVRAPWGLNIKGF
jgi:hypothetical protein